MWITSVSLLPLWPNLRESRRRWVGGSSVVFGNDDDDTY